MGKYTQLSGEEEDEITLEMQDLVSHKSKSKVLVFSGLAAVAVVGIIVVVAVVATSGGGSSQETAVDTEAKVAVDTVSLKLNVDDLEHYGINEDSYVLCLDESAGTCRAWSSESNELCEGEVTTSEHSACEEAFNTQLEQDLIEAIAEQNGLDSGSVNLVCSDGVCSGVVNVVGEDEDVVTNLCNGIDCLFDEDWQCHHFISQGDCAEGILVFEETCVGIGCDAYGQAGCRFCQTDVDFSRRALNDNVNSNTDTIGKSDDDFAIVIPEFPTCTEEVVTFYQTERACEWTSTSTSTSTSTTTTTTTTEDDESDDEVIVPPLPSDDDESDDEVIVPPLPSDDDESDDDNGEETEETEDIEDFFVGILPVEMFGCVEIYSKWYDVLSDAYDVQDVSCDEQNEIANIAKQLFDCIGEDFEESKESFCNYTDDSAPELFDQDCIC